MNVAANLFAVNVPSQFHSRFRSSGSAIYVDRVAGFVSVLTARYARSFVGWSCENKQKNRNTIRPKLYI